MNLQQLLNSQMDLGTIAAAARRGFAWWIDELAALLPASLRERLSSRPRFLAERVSPGVWRYWKDGRPVDLGPTGAGDRPVGLVMARGEVLVEEIPAPRMPTSDVRRMVDLEIDRFSPLASELVHYDVEVERDDSGEQRVLLAVAPRAPAAALVQAARADGLTPVALGAKTGADIITLRFDFLPRVLEGLGERQGRTDRYAWAGVGVLLALNLAVLVGRDMIEISRLQRQADAQAPLVDAVISLQGRVEREAASWRDLVAEGRRHEPLRMLSLVTQAMPSGAWVQHLEWDGQTVRLVGFAKPGIDVASALRASRGFRNVRVLTPSATAGLSRSFDVAAEAPPSGQQP